MNSIYAQLFFIFVKIGAFTLGGGYAMLALVEKVVVDQKHWIKEKDFWNMITVVQSLPGVFAANTALYVGYRIKGVKGALVSMLGAVLPSLLIIIVLAMFFAQFWENEIVKAVFYGIRPCVVALILAPSIKMVKSVGLSLKAAWIPVLAVIAVCVFFVSPVWVILIAGFGGLIWNLISFKLIRKEDSKC